MPWFECDGLVEHGVWWFRIFGRGLCLHAPWALELFSERNGYRRVVRVKRWRITYLPSPPRGVVDGGETG
jgi:hypothetical protein